MGMAMQLTENPKPVILRLQIIKVANGYLVLEGHMHDAISDSNSHVFTDVGSAFDTTNEHDKCLLRWLEKKLK